MTSGVSVALCTFNGEKYLEEQLASIASQTRPPMELVVCDDRSNDSTVEILRRFRDTAPFPVHLSVNERTLGVSRNFAKAIEQCRGEVISLCDQDDVWHPQKLELAEDVMTSSPSVGAVFTNASFVDENLQPLGLQLFDYIGFTTRAKRAVEQGRTFPTLLRINVPGYALAFRAVFREVLLPIPTIWSHDNWSVLVVAALAEVAFIDQALVGYRRHPLNQSIANKQSYRELVQVAIGKPSVAHLQMRRYQLLQERLQQIPSAVLRQNVMYHLDAKIQHMAARAHITGSRSWRLSRILREAITLGYHRYSSGWRSMARDLLVKTNAGDDTE